MHAPGGHFVPATAHRVWQGNQNKEGLPINLKGMSIGNGLTNPEIQYAYFPEYIYNFTMEKLGKPVVSEQVYAKMQSQVPGCVKLIHNCQAMGDLVCKSAQTLCNRWLALPSERGLRLGEDENLAEAPASDETSPEPASVHDIGQKLKMD